MANGEPPPEASRTASEALARLINSFERSWFGPTFEDWHQGFRYAAAYAGALTFFLSFLTLEYPGLLDRLSKDPIVEVAKDFYGVIGVIILPVLFALVIGFRSMSGPTRLYLTGVFLPGIVWIFIQKTLM